MDLWFSEVHTPDVKLSLRTAKQLYAGKSEWQDIEVLDTPAFGKILILNGHVLFSDADDFVYNEMTVHVPMAVHPNPKKVLVIGGGDGGVAQVLTLYPELEQIDIVEPDEMLVEVCREYFPDFAAGLDDPRVTIYYQNGLRFLRNCEDDYDIIINDATDPFGHTEGLFTKEFYGNSYRALKEDGIMIYQHGSPFFDEDESACRSMHRKVNQSFPISRVYQAHIPTSPAGYWLFGFASKKYHPVKDFDKEGWKKRQLFTEYYTANLHVGSFMLPKYVEDILEEEEGKKLSRLLVIGCGGVAQVAISKICQDSETFTEIMIASRTKSKCDDLKAKLEGKTSTKIETAALDADKVEEVIALIESYKPEAVLNVALPYQDLTIMDACLATGVHYIDTANYEAEDTEDPEWRAIYEKRCKELGFTAYFDYSWQWAYQEKFKEAGLTALLGSGFDPGVTSVFSAYALKHYFDEIHYIDILDCNGGDHGYPFATNFNPEINLREVSAPGSYWEDGKWVEVEAMSIKREYDFPQVGQKDMYLLHHEEIESLAKNIPGVKRIRFFMTFGQSYLTHMKCLENVGLLRTDTINFNGQEIVPIQFLKALLPDPASLGPRTVGKTNIGCIFTGVKDGVEKTIYIYNVCDHQECYAEVGSQAISYTTGVPAMIGTKLVMNGTWKQAGVYNLEELDPDPFMEALNEYGLPWVVVENPQMVD
ncbi:spermidine synthase [Streptococcus pneumoniae GA54354]|nr:spermidine synthase [Streptococcus pneumoniae GA54354]